MNRDLIEKLFVEPVEPPENARALLDALAGSMRGQAETFEPAVSHYQAGGLYARRVYVPAGVCVSTRVHKQMHVTIALAGECWVMNERGERSQVVAPAVFVTEPGTARAVYAVTDTQWLTVHAAEPVANAADQVERLTAASFAEFERWNLINALMALGSEAGPEDADAETADTEGWS